MKIFILNAGSSSQKSCLYDLNSLPPHPAEPIWKADIEWKTGENYGVLTVKANDIQQESQIPVDNQFNGIDVMLATLVQGETKVLNNLSEIDVVGHRVVHGGKEYAEATLITSDVKDTITRLIPLAPAHNPAHLAGIKAIETLLGDIPQVAVFDTAFHISMPLEASLYPLPYEWTQKGICRYGFHGTSHQYCAQRAAEILAQPLESLKIITCHLGNGASLTAIKNGMSIDTTMGFTPLDGLMMGTRSGSIDPAILIYLMREYQLNAEQLDKMLNQKSGLKGVSGISNDLREIEQAITEGNEQAKLALDMYIHRLKSFIGSMIASLEGLDVLVFTAGVGENSSLVRERVCQGFAFLGLKLDLLKNESRPVDQDIALLDSTIRVLVIHTQEDWAIAKNCWHLLNSQGNHKGRTRVRQRPPHL